MVKRIPPSPPFFQYQPWQRGPWLGFNWRYDSGLVAGAVPVADGLGTVDLSGLTGGQELQAGLFCGSAHPTLSTPLGTCTSGYGSTLNSLTSPEKEKDDSNPPRVSPPASSLIWPLATTIFPRRMLQMEPHLWILGILAVILIGTLLLFLLGYLHADLH
jgi:hypothetical protein